MLERGVKPPKLEIFVNIASALEVSADTLLQDVVDHSSEGVANTLAADILKLPEKERSRLIICAYCGASVEIHVFSD